MTQPDDVPVHDDSGLRRLPASMTTTLHIGTEHVSATDLADHHPSDLVSLALGDQNTKVVLLGSLGTVRSILDTASGHLDEIGAQRTRRRVSPSAMS
jgi:hypothetical protein